MTFGTAVQQTEILDLSKARIIRTNICYSTLCLRFTSNYFHSSVLFLNETFGKPREPVILQAALPQRGVFPVRVQLVETDLSFSSKVVRPFSPHTFYISSTKQAERRQIKSHVRALMAASALSGSCRCFIEPSPRSGGERPLTPATETALNM